MLFLLLWSCAWVAALALLMLTDHNSGPVSAITALRTFIVAPMALIVIAMVCRDTAIENYFRGDLQ